MQVEIAKFAAEFNVSQDALQSLLSFLIRKIEGNDGLKAAFFANPDAVIKAGVENWHRQSTEFFAELLENKTEAARAIRENIAHDVWVTARRKAGLPIE